MKSMKKMKIFSNKTKVNKKHKKLLGALDKYENSVLKGWACMGDHSHVSVTIKVNNNQIGPHKADIYRHDLKEAGIGEGDFGFEISIPEEFKNNQEHLFEVYASKGKQLLLLAKKQFFIKAEVKNSVKQGAITGSIDQFTGNKVIGWVACSSEDVYPYITANGRPCIIEESGIARPDVKSKQNCEEHCGFVARLPPTDFSNVEFALHGITMAGITSVTKKSIKGANLVPDNISSIFKALEIAKKKDSVGIVVWEGTHNPIGRAQVLFNVIKEKRPTVIITFNIGFSKEPVWEPMINSDCKVLILPWQEREYYAQLFQEIGLNFDLVWICKPRYPAFVMAKAISHKATKYIVDLDDNEIEMSSSKAAEQKPYGLLSAKMAEQYLQKLPVRSVASQSLQEDFGGLMVRHARQENTVKRDRQTDLRKPIRVGFIGTVRPHKGIVEAAKAIKALNQRNAYQITFVVGGIYDPASIRSELIALGCEVHGKIDSSRLNGHLQNLDLIITGFPDINANKEILKYQISSKIADGLSNKRPVLVPEGRSVADLGDVAGINLFNSLNFERILVNAISDPTPITMDAQFSYSFNYQQFLLLEKQAKDEMLTAESLFFADLPEKVNGSDVKNQKKVLLIWKQHDTGLYGRRVDHLARLLANNNIHVTCMEVISESQYKRYEKESIRVDSDYRYILDDYRKKKDGFIKDGIHYKTLTVDYTQKTAQGFKRYLLENKMYPDNTTAVLFPAVPDWKSVVNVLDGYKIICDVVDNQLAWEKKQPLQLLAQYKHLMDISQAVIFNAEDNRQFFEKGLYLNGLNVKVLPNWYILPREYKPVEFNNSPEKIEQEKQINIVYSGNMNDRFDWDTVSRISKEIDANITIHLIGNCQRSLVKMTLVVDDPNIIYHGPMREIDLLNFMKQCDFAIMPHIHDEHSGFMNPMKVNMYQQIGLPCVASSMPGVDFSKDGLFEAISSDDFITIVGEIAKIDSFKPNTKTKFNCEKVGNEYILELSKAEL